MDLASLPRGARSLTASLGAARRVADQRRVGFEADAPVGSKGRGSDLTAAPPVSPVGPRAIPAQVESR